MRFDVVVAMFIRLFFQRSDSLFIQINCVDPSFRTNGFSQSECVITWTATKVSDHLTFCDVGAKFVWVTEQSSEWVIMREEREMLVSFLFARSHFLNLPYVVICVSSAKYFNPRITFFQYLKVGAQIILVFEQHQ